MIRKSAERLSDVCCEHGWIDDEYWDWCVYALEKRISLLLFFSAVALWIIVSGLYVETAAFFVPFYLLRRRIGGWHAKSASACFFISIAFVIIVSSFLGAWAMFLPIWSLIAMDIAAVIFAIILRPEYPPQVNFSAQETDANYQRKNCLLLLIFVFQILSYILLDVRILAHSLCGVGLCVIAVLIQKQKGRQRNEEI